MKKTLKTKQAAPLKAAPLKAASLNVAPGKSQVASHAHPPTRILAGWIAAYVVLTLALVVTVRINATPDEAAHVQYVQHLATLEQFPVFQATGAYDPNGERPPGYEYHQPPLYYLMCMPLWRATGAGVQQYMCRVVSLACGALTLVLLWYAVIALFPNDSRLPVLATGFAALWPLHQGVGASAGNDALAGLIAAAIFYLIARHASFAWTRKDLIILGVLAGLGLLTKSSLLVMLFLAMGAAWHGTQRDRQETQSGMSPVLAAATVLGVCLLVSGWWLVRNQMLYGDPFALNIFNQAFGNDPSAKMMAAVQARIIPVWDYRQALLYLLFCTTWGIFGGPNTALNMYNPFVGTGLRPEATPALLPMFICIVATGLVLLGLLHYIKTRKSQTPETRAALLWWMGGLVLVSLAFISFNTRYFQAQARYFHPALLPMALFWTLGWVEAWRGFKNELPLRISSAVFGVTLVVLTLWNVLSWRTLV